MTGSARKTLTLAALAAVALACSDDDPTGVVTLERQLEAARARWEDQGWTDYDYEITYMCFCGFANRAALVSVESGEVVTAIFIDTEEPIPEGLEPHFTTVDGLFDAPVVPVNADHVRGPGHGPGRGQPGVRSGSGHADGGQLRLRQAGRR